MTWKTLTDKYYLYPLAALWLVVLLLWYLVP